MSRPAGCPLIGMREADTIVTGPAVFLTQTLKSADWPGEA
jgi:hypothetical protein